MCSPTTRTLVVGDMHLKEDAVGQAPAFGGYRG